MKKLLLLTFLLVLPVNASAFNPMVVCGGGVTTVAGDDCPSWGTYWLAWSGGHSSGNTYACTDSGSGSLEGTNYSGTFSGSGHDTTWALDADNERLTWPVTNAVIDHDATGGFTVCMEFQQASMTNITILWEFTGGGDSQNRLDNNIYTRVISASDAVWGQHEAAAVNNNVIGGTITDDGSTWNDVCVSYKIGEAGNDIAVSVNGGSSWTEEDDDIGAWEGTNAEDYIWMGADISSNAADGTTVKSFAVMPGYKTSSPW